MLKNVLLVAVAIIALTFNFRATAAYQFVEGYTVLDTNNAPSIGALYGATSGFERDIAVDSARGIIYIARGQQTTTDGRNAVGISAIVVTNGAGTNFSSNYRDTGLITAPAGWCQSLAYDPASDRIYVLGGPIGKNPQIYSAPGGTLGGAPNGGNPSAQNPALVRDFQVDTNLLDVGVYVSPAVSTNGTPSREGAPRGFAVRTVNGVTTVYLGMGNHVQAWSNDQDTQGGATSAWRRVWATMRPPAGNLVTARVALTGFNGVNGVAVDDAGNCYFSVQVNPGGRIWCVRPDTIQGAADPMSLDFNDLALGGSNEREIFTLIVGANPGVVNLSNPQGITFARFDTQKTLFVSYLPAAAQRAVMRLNVNDSLSISNGGFYLAAQAVDSFGSGQPAGQQDTILSSMRLKQAAAGQPQGTSNNTLYHDVDSVTNPTYLYFQGFVIDTNKGQTIPTATTGKVRINVDTNPPSIVTQPANQTLLEGGTISVSVSAAGMPPLSFQWQSNSVDIPGANSAVYSFKPASTNQSGLYRVIVTNSLGSVVSTTAVVTVNPLVRSEAMMAPSWTLAPGSRTYLTENNMQRGLAFNPATETLLLATRTPSNAVVVLNSVDGSEQFVLGNDPSVIISGTTLPLNMVGASDDGLVYAANLAQNAELFRIYSWISEEAAAPPAVAFSAPANSLGAARYGDSFDVRGTAFNNTMQIIAGSRQGKTVVIFTTTDGGMNLVSNVVQVPEAPNGAFGLSVSFAGPNTFWGKGDQGLGLRLVQFDLANGTGMVLRTYGSATYALSGTVMAVNTNLNVLASISIENPDNLRLYDMSNLDGGPRLVDQELFATDNENINATGAIDFGGGRVYALDSNNGIIAYTLGTIPPPPVDARITILREGNDVRLTWPGTFTLQWTTNFPTGTNFIDVIGAASGYTESVNTATQKYFRLRN